MKSIKKIVMLTLLPMMSLATSCNNTNHTNYANESNWALKKVVNNSKYDLIFLVGTSVMKPTKDNGVGDISDSMKTYGIKNYTSMGSQLTEVISSKNNAYCANIYVPMYRQIALYYALDNYTKHNDIINEIRTKEPYVDLKAMLDYYFTNCNKNAERPFVLAGHSQGSAALQVVFEDYFIKGGHKSYLKNCVAAYSTGYGVSKKWFDGLDKKLDDQTTFHFATGAQDTNCMISWNTEGPGDKGVNFLLSDEKNDTYVINPLNWKSDSTKAEKSENLGVMINNPDYDPDNPFSPLYIRSDEDKDKFDATINVERGSIEISEEREDLYVDFPPYGKIWGGKSLHTCDGARFYFNMSRNLGDRLDAWFGK